MKKGIQFVVLFLVIVTFFLFSEKADAAISMKAPVGLGLVGYWPLNGDANDASGNGNNGSNVGGVSFVAGKVNQAGSFNGSSNYVQVPDSTIFHPANTLTLSAWIKGGTSNNVIVEHQKTYAMSYALGVDGNQKLNFYIGNYASDPPYVTTLTSVATVADGNWHFVMGTYDGANMKIYVDGKLDSIQATTGNIVYDYDGAGVRIGYHVEASTYFNGQIDEVRIYNRTLSVTEVNVQYYSGLAAKMKAISNNGLVGYWPFEEGVGTNAGDMSGSNNGGTITGATWVDGKRGKALSFNGSSTYLSAATVPVTATDNWTMSAWVNPASFTTDDMAVVANGYDDGITGNGFTFVINNGQLKGLYCGLVYFDSGYTFPATNTWYHVVLLRDNGVAKFYVNGVQTANTYSAMAPTTPTQFRIGSATGTRFFSGKIDEVRIYNRVLATGEISSVYSVGATKFNASQNNQLASGLVGLWSFNGADMNGTTAYDRSGNGNDGTLVNGPTPAEGRVGQGLSFIKANSQKITATSSSSLNITGPLSISAWVKLNSLPTASNFANIISKYDIGANAGGYDFRIFNNAGTYQIGLITYNGTTGGSNQDYNLTPFIGQWVHLAAVYDGANSIVYVNGAEATRVANSVNPIANTKLLNIGNHGIYNGSELSRYLDGKMDEVRLYNRALSASEVSRLYNLAR